mmetsp:Transcript_56609/g.132577  ORF Transcript_56609/g.132577 Transcript_56609/m.132577 type:complete len:345 (-) Transcript_56609:1688-2722(-)
MRRGSGPELATPHLQNRGVHVLHEDVLILDLEELPAKELVLVRDSDVQVSGRHVHCQMSQRTSAHDTAVEILWDHHSLHVGPPEDVGCHLDEEAFAGLAGRGEGRRPVELVGIDVAQPANTAGVADGSSAGRREGDACILGDPHLHRHVTREEGALRHDDDNALGVAGPDRLGHERVGGVLVASALEDILHGTAAGALAEQRASAIADTRDAFAIARLVRASARGVVATRASRVSDAVAGAARAPRGPVLLEVVSGIEARHSCVAAGARGAVTGDIVDRRRVNDHASGRASAIRAVSSDVVQGCRSGDHAGQAARAIAARAPRNVFSRIGSHSRHVGGCVVAGA